MLGLVDGQTEDSFGDGTLCNGVAMGRTAECEEERVRLCLCVRRAARRMVMDRGLRCAALRRSGVEWWRMASVGRRLLMPRARRNFDCKGRGSAIEPPQQWPRAGGLTKTLLSYPRPPLPPPPPREVTWSLRHLVNIKILLRVTVLS